MNKLTKIGRCVSWGNIWTNIFGSEAKNLKLSTVPLKWPVLRTFYVSVYSWLRSTRLDSILAGFAWFQLNGFGVFQRVGPFRFQWSGWSSFFRNPLLVVWPLVGALFAFLGHLEESISGQEAEEELNEGVDSDETRCEDSEDQVRDGDDQKGEL